MDRGSLLAAPMLLLATQALAGSSYSTSTSPFPEMDVHNGVKSTAATLLDVGSASAVTLWPLSTAKRGHTSALTRSGHASSSTSTRTIDRQSKTADELVPLTDEASENSSSGITLSSEASSVALASLPLTEEDGSTTTTSWARDSSVEFASTASDPLAIELSTSGIPTDSSSSTSDALAIGASSKSDALAIEVSSTSDALAIGASSMSDALAFGPSSKSDALAIGASSTSDALAIGASSTSDALAFGPSSKTHALAIEPSSKTDALAIGTSSKIGESGSALAIDASSSTTDPLAIKTWTSSRTKTSRGFGKAQTAHASLDSALHHPVSWLQPGQQGLEPCKLGYPPGIEGCRVHLGGQCLLSLYQYPTCVGNECMCLAAPCGSKEDCSPYHQCWDDEEAQCRTEAMLYPRFPGVCGCVPKERGA
ncbi:hypothetical protein OCS_01219 [Ophiocordyceps sinensis CO18]|uniref:Uncharacterized protein n=1 Tax=Ophiocordyceps sinensis (strain Co18 / CGMCC 3.14243) TaxID=911162 RepID=T5AMS4_OPHSC|nr:hypothetical protein OCS_01219 [Ophiocordyceps sinensis CO18]